MSSAALAPAAPQISDHIDDDASQRVPFRSMLRHVGAVTRRYLILIKNDPEQLMDVVLMPIIFLLLFGYVFGGAISGSTHAYLQFVVPGMLVMTSIMAGSTTGVGINTDLNNGVMDRFRSLPIARSAVLVGRLLSDQCRLLLGAAITVAFASLLGFRFQTNAGAALLAVLLVMAFSFALGWVFMIVGIRGKNPQAVQGLSVLVTMPLQFGSSMFVQADTMPGWLQAFVEVNPMTHVINACRGLMTGGAYAHDLWISLAWIAGIIVVAAPVAVRMYRKKI
ncbi:ABC transporter permease [Phaeacidiphilus oryzae]|uniref:ABC transporter permease n=1 Tax=Phaeacidiphilus oryzae TaxID=348818 RepID=UPI000A025BE2|nr:ABC transporter permease [Phaeacidiphilus oryzae]